MPDNPLVYRLHRAWAGCGVVINLVMGLGFAGVALAVAAQVPGTLASFTPDEGYIFPVLVLGGLIAIGGVGAAGSLYSAVCNWKAASDPLPKLTIDRDGIIDHRAEGGDARIRWQEIASVDAVPSREFGTVLVFYLRPDAGEVATRDVPIGDLDQPAGVIYQVIKKRLIVLAAAAPPHTGEGGAGDDADARGPGPAGQPGAFQAAPGDRPRTGPGP